ncbi:hypothetical protein D3C73_979410 [compost metagenome]
MPVDGYYYYPSNSVDINPNPAWENDFVGQDVFPNTYERDREDAGIVLKPKAKDLDLTNTYEDWLNPSIADSISNPAQVRDVVDTGTGEVAQDGTLTDSIPREGVDNPSIPGTIPTDWTTPDKIELDFTPLYVATYKFPFCIPYDFYNLIKSFESSRRAPVWTVDFSEVANITGAGGGSFTIDMGNEYFSKFAMVFRYFLLVAFCVALYVRTKSFMGW